MKHSAEISSTIITIDVTYTIRREGYKQQHRSRLNKVFKIKQFIIDVGILGQAACASNGQFVVDVDSFHRGRIDRILSTRRQGLAYVLGVAMASVGCKGLRSVP